MDTLTEVGRVFDPPSDALACKLAKSEPNARQRRVRDPPYSEPWRVRDPPYPYFLAPASFFATQASYSLRGMKRSEALLMQ